MRGYRFEQLDSTNRFLMDLSKKDLVPAYCIAEHQTSGYGQRQRQWISKPGSILFSILLPYSTPCHLLAGFSQQVAICVHRILNKNLNGTLNLKWPNDIFLNGKKVSGVLIEVAKCEADGCWLVIGVGINAGKFTSDDGLSSAGFLELTDHSKELIISELQQTLINLSNDWGTNLQGFEQEYWASHDYFLDNELVVLTHNTNTKVVNYHGLTHNAEIITAINDDASGHIVYSHGEVSIRKMESN